MKKQIALAFLVAGCGGGKQSSTPDAATTGDVYAVATTVNANSPSATSLLFALGRLDSGMTDSSTAIAIADTVSLFGVEGSGRFFTTQAMTPLVTRYDVNADGTITAGPQLDLSGLGLGSTYSTRSVVFVSSTKAYLFDDTTLKAVIFDPSAMTLGATIDLSAMTLSGYHVNFAYNVPMRGTQVVLAGYYYDSSYARTIPTAKIALIDSTTDTVTFLDEPRCGTFTNVVTADNGDLYFGSDSFASAIHRVAPTAAPAGCILRMKSGEQTMDAGFQLTIPDVTGGKTGGGVVPGPGHTLYTRVLDESLYPVSSATSSTVLLSQPAWRWWQIDLDAPSVATQSTASPGTGEVKFFVANGTAYAGSSADSHYSTSVVEDLRDAAQPTDGTLVNGFLSGVVKVSSR